jgi:transglutaminase/protease-like cytokinesis protein 3
MGISQHSDEGYETYSGSAVSSREPTFNGTYPTEGKQQHSIPPDLNSYVDRMERNIRNMHRQDSAVDVADDDDAPPPPPKKNPLYDRPKSSMDVRESSAPPKLRRKKSAYEVGREMLGRTFTTKTTSTTMTQSTNRSLMSGVSAGAISATSAGSLARKNMTRAQSAMGMRDSEIDRPETPFTGVTYHSSHASEAPRPKSQAGFHELDVISGIGGLVSPRPKKQNFIKRILESAKTGVASTRGSIATAGAGSVAASLSRPTSRAGGALPSISGFGSSSIAGGPAPETRGDTAREMGLGGGIDWVQVRRDVNRSNSLSRNERVERRDRCLMLDYPAIEPVDELYSSIEGDEDGNGNPVRQPTDYHSINFGQVDKNSRFIANLPPQTTAVTLATMYVCRPYRSDVQRLRAIFTWVAEKVCWEEDFEGEIDTRRVIATKRACSEEYAVLVYEMCGAVGLTCEIVRGYLKPPGEIPETSIMPRSNHWWNAVLVDNEWRMMDCSLASPSNPKRGQYSSVPGSSADSWWFLTRPAEICWTHIPEHHAQQHVVPPVAHEILLNLPCACPPYFRSRLGITDYNTALTRIEDLEMVHVKFTVPADVEVAAEVETRAYARDPDGDFFESGDVVRKRALAQAEWFNGQKRYTVKAVLPGDEGAGTLKVYAGKRGLMHSIKDIPHPLAFALPIVHSGENPAYDFVVRHPTPHAQRHDIYVVQPQCQRLALNNTFVFAVRQHPSSLDGEITAPVGNPLGGVVGRGPSPVPFARPGSAMSMTSSSAAGSNPSTSSSGSGSSSGGARKPAKLAIQTPGGKILRLMRKEERKGVSVGGRTAGGEDGEVGDGGTWETIIKCSERGVWRGLVLADRTARWCVFAEWVCVG